MPILAPILAGLLEGLMWLFRTQLGRFIVGALLWLGLSFSTQKVVMGPAISQLTSLVTNIGSQGGDYGAIAIQWLGVLKFDVAISMIVGTYASIASVAATRAFLTKRA